MMNNIDNKYSGMKGMIMKNGLSIQAQEHYNLKTAAYQSLKGENK